MNFIQRALGTLAKIKSLIVIRDNKKQKAVDAEVDSIMGHIRALYPSFMEPSKEFKVIRTAGAIELDHMSMSNYKQSFRDLGIALINATPELQEAGFNMILRFGNNMLPVKVYKQVDLGRGRQCRMMKPVI